MLAARGLGYARGTSTLFDGLNFELPEGCLLLLRGANGSGKTSLLRILAGLAGGFHGTVTWQGRALSGRQVLFLGHIAPFKDDLTARENLEHRLRLEGRQCGGGELDQTLDGAGLAGRAHLRARLLSRGQRQRIGLAWLALTQRPLWLLDEPQTALDDAGTALLCSRLDAHLAVGGCAVVATHLDLPVKAGARTLVLA